MFSVNFSSIIEKRKHNVSMVVYCYDTFCPVLEMTTRQRLRMNVAFVG
jgi:hypothetical protein